MPSLSLLEYPSFPREIIDALKRSPGYLSVSSPVRAPRQQSASPSFGAEIPPSGFSLFTTAQTLPSPSAISTSSSSTHVTSMATTTTPTSAVQPSPTTAHTDSGQQHTTTPDANTKTIVFSVIGGIFGLLFLAFIFYYIIQRYRRNLHKRHMHGSFWEHWHWETYSTPHGDVVPVDQGLDTTAGYDVEQSKRSSAWWQRFQYSGVSSVGEENEKPKKKKQRMGTLYKVKRLKPGHTFEIDSDSRMSVVSLTSDSSH